MSAEEPLGRHPARRTFPALVDRAAAFFQHPQFVNVGVGISRKRPFLACIFAIVRLLGGSRLGNVLLIIVVVLAYEPLRVPAGGQIFQFGTSANNIRVLRRGNVAASREQWNATINGKTLAFKARLRTLRQVAWIWAAATELRRRHQSSGFSHAQLVLTCAAYLVYRQEPFRHIRCVCVASDHSPIVLGLLHAAREKNLRTCYIQHAPVADYFPPLDYDLSLLFDRASIAIYDKIAKRQDVSVVGKVAVLPPFEQDAIPPTLPPRSPYHVGICLSYLFDARGLNRLIDELLALENVGPISMRRHPRCKADLGPFFRAGRPVTEASSASLAEFARNCDIVLVPNSGVAIELLHLGKPVMYTPGLDYISYDYYGFVREGVLPIFELDALKFPERLQSFFGGEWQRRYVAFDETVQQSLQDLNARAGKALVNLVEGEEAESTARQSHSLKM